MTLKEIDELIEEGQSLKTIAQAYSEIANLKIKRIRAEADRNRIFFKEVSLIFGMIKALALKKKITLPKPKKRVCLILTSNYRFYGNINAALINFFIESTQSISTDRIILGKSAVEYFKTSRLILNYQEILLKTDLPSYAELTQLVNMIKDYSHVLVFYSRMKSLLVQEPVVSDLYSTAEILEEKGQGLRFIFEPELNKILNFFDSQILTLLLKATFLESEVSRTASRFISMDQAETAANNFIKEYQKLRAYNERNIKNNQILEAIAALKKGVNYEA